MLLSVVILNYNVAPFLALCISSVQKAIQAIDAEIIVVDNASTDFSEKMMQESFPEILFIANKENVGFPKGNNIGVQHAKGKYICILNPDTVVAEDTFSQILAFSQTKPDLGIVGCHLVDGSGTFLAESKRGIPTPWVAFTKVLGLYHFFPKNKWFNQYYAQHISEFQTGEVSILVGAFMFLTKELYEKVGGFDEGCFMYSDDIDLSYLALLENKKNWYYPETSVIHFKGESTLKDGTYFKRFQEAMQFFYAKHFKKSLLFDAMMKVGMAVFAFKKKTEKGPTLAKLDLRIIVTEQPERYHHFVQKTPDLIFCSEKETEELIQKYRSKRIEFWFDMDHYSYKSYISFIKKHSGKKITFKIKPSNFDFFIGSNDKNDRGEVVFL